MINLLSGEFYKLRKAKVVYICSLIIVALILFMYATLIMVDKIQKGEVENGSMGITVVNENAVTDEGAGTEDNMEADTQQGAPSVWDEISILEVEGQMFKSFGSLIVAIFAAIFVIVEYGNGAIKNVVGKGYARWKIFLAKYVSTIVTGTLMLILMAVVTLIVGILVRGTEGLDGAFFGDMLKYTGLQLLLGMALTGVIITVSEFCRNLGAGISSNIGIILCSTLITKGLDLAFRLIFGKESFQPSNYWISDLISNCPITDIDSTFAMRAVVSSLLWIVISVVIGILHFKKADVK